MEGYILINLDKVGDFFITNFGGSNFFDIFWILVDVSLVATFLYKIILLARETRAWQLLKGIVFILLAAKLTSFLGLKTTAYILDHLIQYIAIALVVIFQPELRRALEKIGRSRFKSWFSFEEPVVGEQCSSIIDEVVDAALELSKHQTGALIVFERVTKIGDIISSGVSLDAAITAKLILNIFTPNTPLHDGAVVISGERIKAAACFLPLSDNSSIPNGLGTRHRAGIGITETTDAMALIVSEETGRISVSMSGKLKIGLDKQSLREVLCKALIPVPNKAQERRKLRIWKVKSG